MAEEFQLATGSKAEQYQALIPQIEALLQGEKDQIANLANLSAVLMTQFQPLWVGFYLVKGEELVLGPFQGPIACTRIARGTGVCGSAWAEGRTLIVPDVDAFPGHIACSSLSKSEIVVPLWSRGQIIGVLDIDSTELNFFDEIDAKYLEHLLTLLPEER